MTDQKRDESFDLAINLDSMEFRLWKNAQGDARLARYVPHADLVAAEFRAEEIAKDCHAMAQEIEHERAILDDVKSWASEEINELRATIAAQKARIEELEGKLSALERAWADSCDD